MRCLDVLKQFFQRSPSAPVHYPPLLDVKHTLVIQKQQRQAPRVVEAEVLATAVLLGVANRG